MITKLWEVMHNIWKFQNGAQHGVTKEEKKRRANEKIHPRIRSAYRTQRADVSYFNQRLFEVELNRRLDMDSKGNEQWLEIVETARKNKWVRQEAVLAAMRKIHTYFPKVRDG